MCAIISTVCSAHSGTYLDFGSFECELQASDVWSHQSTYAITSGWILSQYNSKTIYRAIENANLCAIVSTICTADGGTYIGTISGANACTIVSTVCSAFVGTH